MSKHHGGNYYISIARANELKVTNGKGSHFKVEGEIDGQRTVMTIPNDRELATGTECAIKKWFIRLGILVILGIGAMSCYITSLGLAMGLRP